MTIKVVVCGHNYAAAGRETTLENRLGHGTVCGHTRIWCELCLFDLIWMNTDVFACDVPSDAQYVLWEVCSGRLVSYLNLSLLCKTGLSHRYKRRSVMNAELTFKCFSRIKDTHWNSIPKWSVAVISLGQYIQLPSFRILFSILCGCCLTHFSGCH